MSTFISPLSEPSHTNHTSSDRYPSFEGVPTNEVHLGTPTDDEVRRLLRASTATPDVRAAAAVTILLALGLELNLVRQLRWRNVRQKGTLLETRSRRISDEAVPITKLLARQLLAIGLKNPLDRIFAKPKMTAPSLDALFAQVLEIAGLSNYRWSDFVRWSKQQSTATRVAVATLLNEAGCR